MSGPIDIEKFAVEVAAGFGMRARAQMQYDAYNDWEILRMDCGPLRVQTAIASLRVRNYKDYLFHALEDVCMKLKHEAQKNVADREQWGEMQWHDAQQALFE